MKLEQVIKELQSVKGDGEWRAIARLSGIHYDTVARIARRSINAPSVQTIEAISDAIEQRRNGFKTHTANAAG